MSNTTTFCKVSVADIYGTNLHTWLWVSYELRNQNALRTVSESGQPYMVITYALPYTVMWPFM